MDNTNLQTNRAQYPAESRFNKVTGEKKMKKRNVIKNVHLLLDKSRMQSIKTSSLQDLCLQCKQILIKENLSKCLTIKTEKLWSASCI